MRSFVLLITVIACSLNFQEIHAQDALNKWSITLGLNAVINPVRVDLPNEIDRFETFNLDPAGFKLNVSRYLGAGFSFGAVGSINNIDTNDNSGDELAYISIDGAFKYNLSKGLIFKPYLTTGGGYSWLDDVGAPTANGGIGFNIFITNNFGINVEGIYKYTFRSTGVQHHQYSAGLVYKFGAKDKDKDGIKDDDDDCPDEFGLLKFNGCPDTDGDGVKDSEDACPDMAGLKELNGCPDADGDGIKDLEDECPEIAGPKNLRGCPDSDGDGVPDKFDSCPDIKGATNNRGCPIPDTDNDGVDDSKDKCPNQAGPANNAGCPIQKAKDQLVFKRITFEYGKVELTQDNKTILDDIATTINLKSGKIFHIAGHADNTFSDEHNLNLSRQRAEIVKNYLVQKGVDEARLTVKGYGETRPLDPNDTESDEARAKNRRVEIFQLN